MGGHRGAIIAPMVAAFLVGCPSEEPASDVGTVIVGVTSDLRAGVDIASLRVVMRQDGATVREEVLPPKGDTLTLPLEFAFADRPAGRRVEIALDGFTAGSSSPLVSRLASTDVVANRELLLRASLDAACVLTSSGSPNASCTLPDTCAEGRCVGSYQDPSQLEPYSSHWADGPPDACKSAAGGEAVVVVGEGQSDYLPLDDMQVVQVEAGPQGGHHVWVAIRMKNLHQSGTITSVVGRVTDLDLELDPFNVIFTFDQGEGGYCELAGLRYQIDTDYDIATLLGHVLEITVTATDSDGDVGVGTRTVKLSDDTI